MGNKKTHANNKLSWKFLSCEIACVEAIIQRGSLRLNNEKEYLKKMVLDIVLFRKDQGGDPEIVKESQRRRFKPEADVDAVIEADEKFKKRT